MQSSHGYFNMTHYTYDVKKPVTVVKFDDLDDKEWSYRTKKMIGPRKKIPSFIKDFDDNTKVSIKRFRSETGDKMEYYLKDIVEINLTDDFQFLGDREKPPECKLNTCTKMELDETDSNYVVEFVDKLCNGVGVLRDILAEGAKVGLKVPIDKKMELSNKKDEAHEIVTEFLDMLCQKVEYETDRRTKALELCDKKDEANEIVTEFVDMLCQKVEYETDRRTKALEVPIEGAKVPIEEKMELCDEKDATDTASERSVFQTCDCHPRPTFEHQVDDIMTDMLKEYEELVKGNTDFEDIVALLSEKKPR